LQKKTVVIYKTAISWIIICIFYFCNGGGFMLQHHYSKQFSTTFQPIFSRRVGSNILQVISMYKNTNS